MSSYIKFSPFSPKLSYCHFQNASYYCITNQLASLPMAHEQTNFNKHSNHYLTKEKKKKKKIWMVDDDKEKGGNMKKHTSLA